MVENANGGKERFGFGESMQESVSRRGGLLPRPGMRAWRTEEALRATVREIVGGAWWWWEEERRHGVR